MFLQISGEPPQEKLGGNFAGQPVGFTPFVGNNYPGEMRGWGAPKSEPTRVQGRDSAEAAVNTAFLFTRRGRVSAGHTQTGEDCTK